MTHTQSLWFYEPVAGAIVRGGTPRVNYTQEWRRDLYAQNQTRSQKREFRHN